MAYADLTAEQKAVVDNYNNNLRAIMGEMARLVRKAQVLKKQLNEVVTPLITTWDGTAIVPNNGGLAGASPSATKNDLLNWQSYGDSVVTAVGSDGHFGQFVAAAGPDNVG